MFLSSLPPSHIISLLRKLVDFCYKNQRIIHPQNWCSPFWETTTEGTYLLQFTDYLISIMSFHTHSSSARCVSCFSSFLFFQCDRFCSNVMHRVESYPLSSEEDDSSSFDMSTISPRRLESFFFIISSVTLIQFPFSFAYQT